MEEAKRKRRDNYISKWSDYYQKTLLFNECDYTRLGVEKEQKQFNNEGKIMEIPVKAHRVVQEGLHEGTITGVVYREEPLPYTDYVIEFEDGLSVKASYPTNLTPETIHGRMLERFGMILAVGQTINPDKLIGTKCSFVTVNHTTPKGTFPEVMRDSLKPLLNAPMKP